jgi:hypothetical protein
VNHRSRQYRHLAFNNQVGNHRQHRDCRERNTEPPGNSELECALRGSGGGAPKRQPFSKGFRQTSRACIDL